MASSYHERLKADNLIQRQFEATKPMQKCYTDVTEFSFQQEQKLYLSPVLDGFNMKCPTIFLLPNLVQMKAMLEAFDSEPLRQQQLASELRMAIPT